MRRFILPLIIFLLVVVGAQLTVSYLRSFQKLTIVFDNNSSGLKATVYKAPADSHELSSAEIKTNENMVSEVASNQTLKLKKGNYLVSSGGSGDYQVQESGVTLSSPQTVTINPAYTDAKLASLLMVESTAIKQSMESAIPGISTNYLVSPGKLFANGEWYGTTLTVNATPEQFRTQYFDTYRFVAHKDNGTWKVVTLPPNLSLSSKLYPSIPRDILKDVNNLQP